MVKGMEMDTIEPGAVARALDAHAVASCRRDGFVVLRGMLSPRLVAAALGDISGL